MNGYRLRVWVGRDGIMFVTCFSVSIVVSGFSYAAQSMRCLLQGIQIHASPVADTASYKMTEISSSK